MDRANPEAETARENILVRGVNWLGDAVMTTPALLRLRESRPRARMTLLTPAKLAGLWEGQSFLDELMVVPAGAGLFQTASRLRAGRFSIAVALPNSFRSALELWLAGIPRRAGYARPGRTLLLTDPVVPRSGAVRMRKRGAREIRSLIKSNAKPPSIPPAAHHIYDYLHLVATLGASEQPLAPSLSLGQKEATRLADKMGMDQESARPWFGLNPGAEYGPAKRWPAERFVAAALELQKRTQCRWVVFGVEADRELAAGIAEGIGGAAAGSAAALNLAGRTNLRELMAGLKCCRLLLTNDSGPMHLAAALGTPVVALFGSTCPEMTGPKSSDCAQVVRASEVACSPCFLRQCPVDFRCMKGILPAEVVEAGLRVLEARG